MLFTPVTKVLTRLPQVSKTTFHIGNRIDHILTILKFILCFNLHKWVYSVSRFLGTNPIWTFLSFLCRPSENPCIYGACKTSKYSSFFSLSTSCWTPLITAFNVSWGHNSLKVWETKCSGYPLQIKTFQSSSISSKSPPSHHIAYVPCEWNLSGPPTTCS